MTRFLRSTLFTLTAVALATGGCRKKDTADEFRDSIPTHEAVSIKVPEKAGGQALTIENSSQAVLGARSEFYTLTVGVRDIVNGGTLFSLALVKLVTSFPPTTVTADSAVWGPWSDALKPTAWKVTVTRVGDHYDYRFEGKDKHAVDAAFVTVLSGSHKPAVDADGDPIEGFGSGTLKIDWEAGRTLPDANPNDRGTAEITYARPALGQPVTVSARFRQVWDKDEKRLADADYSYASEAGKGGALDFTYSTVKPEPGKAAMRSRWLEDGRGRADMKLTTPTVTATATDCWDIYFQSAYQVTSWDPSGGYGDVGACPYATPEYSTLQL